MANGASQIVVDQMGIAQVLSRHQLTVPTHQREYSWTEEEVRDLFEDLAKAINDGDAEYFLGSIVAIPRGATGLEIIDGQQRLATTVILFAAIKAFLVKRGADQDLISDLERDYLSKYDKHTKDHVQRLKLNSRDNVFFDKRVIQNDSNVRSSARSHRRIEKAIKLADEHIKNIVRPVRDQDQIDVLLNWVEYLEEKARVILLRVPGTGNAYKMFETLNDRGLKTSQADLVKNYLFGAAGSRLQEAEQKWNAMLGILEQLDDQDMPITFLRHTLISLHGHTKASDVYETVQEKTRGPVRALTFLSSLEDAASDYVALLNPEHPKWNPYPAGTDIAIRHMCVLGPKPIRPLLLSIARSFSPKEASIAFRKIINISVRYLIAGNARSGSVEEGLAATAKQITDGKITTASEMMESLDKILVKDKQFEEGFRAARVSKEPLARYYLRALESTNQGEKEPYFIPNENQAEITLEHVLPERPCENWPQFDQEAVDAFSHRIGNLALLKKKSNSDLRSAPFSEKKKVYAASAYSFTKQISDEKEWTAEAIENRQKVMARIAVKTWSL